MRPGLSFSLVLLSIASTVVAQTPGDFAPIGSMITFRTFHTATLLYDGRVLIAGGTDRIAFGTFSTPHKSAELYDPSTRTFAPTGDMAQSRWSHTATLLPDGKVLIAGGRGPGDQILSSAELYDPYTGAFTNTGNMSIARQCHQAFLLGSGKVLLAGGSGRGYPGPAAEVYDPATGSFAATGTYNKPSGSNTCQGAVSTLLSDGRVLIVWEDGDAERYDPASGTFSLTGGIPHGYNEGLPTATLLRDSRVLVAGGRAEAVPHANADLYEPSTGIFTPTGNMNTPRYDHTATLLPDGAVLFAGFGQPSAEIYNPATGTFRAAANLTTPRWGGQTATLLHDGTVLFAGGNYPSSAASAELYIPSVLVPTAVVKDLRFDRSLVVAGSSYSVEVSGSSLTGQTFFDVRFTSPAGNGSAVVLNWQRGPAASHGVAAGTALGRWTINGVRPHEIETDHTGIFFPVSATLTVSP